MDSEIRAIMAQYMPLDNQEGQIHVHHGDIWVGSAAYLFLSDRSCQMRRYLFLQIWIAAASFL